MRFACKKRGRLTSFLKLLVKAAPTPTLTALPEGERLLKFDATKRFTKGARETIIGGGAESLRGQLERARAGNIGAIPQLLTLGGTGGFSEQAQRTRRLTSGDGNVTNVTINSQAFVGDEAQARDFYEKLYVIGPRFNQLPERVVHLVVDCGVNHGVRAASKWVQRAVGAKQDGWIGPNTIQAVQDQNVLATKSVFVQASDGYLHCRA